MSTLFKNDKWEVYEQDGKFYYAIFGKDKDTEFISESFRYSRDAKRALSIEVGIPFLEF